MASAEELERDRPLAFRFLSPEPLVDKSRASERRWPPLGAVPGDLPNGKDRTMLETRHRR
jgi:hypothetical protein